MQTQALFLVRQGDAARAFEQREMRLPEPGPEQVLLEVEAFGLNFADVMARKGLYRDRPPLPCVVGYDVVGRVLQCGRAVTRLQAGQRVTAMTRFGGYARHALTDARAAAPIPETMDAGQALALTTQYCTAWYSAEACIRIREGENVLVHAAAGGVGTALVQMARRRGAVLYGTAGSPAKLQALAAAGVHHPIDYRQRNWAAEVRRLAGDRGLDVVFDSVGGRYFREGLGLLRAGGRMVAYGASSLSSARNGLDRAWRGLSFGLYHPIRFLMPSVSLIGVNMLRIADERPELLATCLDEVVRLTAEGEFEPVVGGRFEAGRLAEAHSYLESRASSGKIAVFWDQP